MKSFATVLVLATSAAAIKVSYDGMSKYDAFAELASQAYGFTQYDVVDTTSGPEVTDSSGYESTGFTGYELDGFNGTEATGSSGTDAADPSGTEAFGSPNYEPTGFSPLPTFHELMDFNGFGWDWAAMHGTNSTSYGDYNSTSYGDYNHTSHNSTDVDHDWDWDFTYDEDETFGWSGEDGTGDDEHHGPWGPWGPSDASWGDEYDDGTMGGSWGDAYGDGYGIGSHDDPDAMAAFGGDSYGEFLGQVNAFGY